jgi:hypothetical protein
MAKNYPMGPKVVEIPGDGKIDLECSMPCALPEQVREALRIAMRHGQHDEAHHKAWVIDQMVRALTGDQYAAWVAESRAGEDGPETYDWDEGIAP